MRSLLLAACLLALPAVSQASYKFTIENNTDQDIVGIEVSEDGETWGDFDVGDGIPAGGSAEATWAEHTDDGNCEWMFRAEFEGGTTSEAIAFDFCEDDLTIEFE
jgi:hypothetical protein